MGRITIGILLIGIGFLLADPAFAAVEPLPTLSFHIVEWVQTSSGMPVPVLEMYPAPDYTMRDLLVWCSSVFIVSFVIGCIIRYYTKKNSKCYIGTTVITISTYYFLGNFVHHPEFEFLGNPVYLFALVTVIASVVVHYVYFCIGKFDHWDFAKRRGDRV